MRMTTWGRLAVAAVGVACVAGCGGGAPKTQATVATTGTSATASPTAAAAATGPGAPGNGTFTIDGTVSTVSYTAHETFLQQNSPFTPVGKTSAVAGDLALSGGKFVGSRVTVDLRTLRSNDARRDRHIQQDPLQTGTYPNAVFAITGETGAAPAVTDGQAVSLQLSGNMTIHGTTRPMVWDAKAELEGGTLHLTGSTSFQLPDFGMQPPDIAGFVTVQPGIALSVDLTAKNG